ncbi:hypothetical protein ABG067_002553 [Albugo candida]
MNAFLQCFFPTDSDRDCLSHEHHVNDVTKHALNTKLASNRCHSLLVLPHVKEDGPGNSDLAYLRERIPLLTQQTHEEVKRVAFDSRGARSYSERLLSRSHEPELPELIGAFESKILCNMKHQKMLMGSLQASLPHRFRNYNWNLLYTSSHHGASLETFMHRVKNDSPTLILLETVHGDVFGGFVTTPWQTTSSYYGNGECYVFSCTPEFRKYTWTKRNSFFMLSNCRCIAMGGGYEY